MNSFETNKHAVQLLFTISLFLIFIISAIAVILCGARVYQKTSADAVSNYEVRASLSYITEKVRQCDNNGGVHIEDHNGISTLALDSVYNNEPYVTYIYYYNGTLNELFTNRNYTFQENAGTPLTSIASITFEQLNTNGHNANNSSNSDIIQITITDLQNTTHEILVHPNSQKGDSL